MANRIVLDNTWAASAYAGIVRLSPFPSAATLPWAVGTNRSIFTTSPITGGGFLTSDLTISIPQATGSESGYLGNLDWALFNQKVDPTRRVDSAAPLTGGGDLSSDLTILIPAATSGQDGYLAGDDWITFDAKLTDAPNNGQYYVRHNGGWAATVAAGSMTADLYTNPTPVPVTIGGIVAGATFDLQTTDQMWTALLYPYQSPAFTSFSISGQTTTLEVGNSSNTNPTFTWGTTNASNVATNSINITDVTSAESLVTGHSNGGSVSITHVAITKISATSEQYQIQGTNTHSVTFAANYYITWLWRVYHGESGTTPLVEADIEALRVSELKSGFAGTWGYVAATAQYKYLAFPSLMGTATSFKDSSTNLDVPFETPYTVSVTNTYGVTTNYSVYRTTNQIGSSINIIVS